MDVKLVVVGGDAQSAEYSLQLPTIVGRSRSADLKLPHPLVSRKHCEFYEHEGQLVIRDLGSLNGTFVGETRISDPAFVPPGGIVTIGSVTFQAVYGDMNGEQLAEADTGEMPDFMATASAEPAATATPIEQTMEMSDVESPVTEPVGEEAAASGEEGFDFGWLDDEPGESPQAAANGSANVAAEPEKEVIAEVVEEEEVEAIVEAELDLPEPANSNGEVEHTVDNEFAPPEEQPAGGGGDDDLSDFFANLK